MPTSKVDFLRRIMRALANDQDPETDFDTVDQAIAHLKNLVRNMDPTEREHFLGILQSSDLGDLLLGNTTATNDGSLGELGQALAGSIRPTMPGYAKDNSLSLAASYGDPRGEPRLRAADRKRRAAQDAAFDAKMRSSGSRALAKAYAEATPGLALDRQPIRSLEALCPEIARVRRA